MKSQKTHLMSIIVLLLFTLSTIWAQGENTTSDISIMGHDMSSHDHATMMDHDMNMNHNMGAMDHNENHDIKSMTSEQNQVSPSLLDESLPHAHTDSPSSLPSATHSDQPTEKSINWLNMILILIFITGTIFFIRSIQGKDLLEYNLLKRLAKSKLYPGIIQFPTFILFGFIIYYFFFGSFFYANNPGSILAWTLWWPLVPLTFILFGRIWCVACPLPIIGDFIQKFTHPTRKAGNFLKTYGIWIVDGLFILITLFDRLYGMVETPWLSGTVFALLLAGVLVISLRYERRTFCKHLCFLGGVSGNYSMLSTLSIESKDKSVCNKCNVKACYFGSGKADPCTYFNVIPTKEGMRNCTLCADCIKNCPNDNVSLRIRSVASELWSHVRVSFSESFFAKLMVGVVIIQNLGMLALWFDLQTKLMAYGLGEKTATILLYFSAIALPLLLMTLTSYVSNHLQTTPNTTKSNFAAFGYAFIPIDVAGHIAHNLYHLLSEGKQIIGAFLGLFTGKVTMTGPLASSTMVTTLQYTLIILGSFGTIYVAYRIAKAKEQTSSSALKILLPHALLLLIIIAVNLYLFSQPMMHRG